MNRTRSPARGKAVSSRTRRVSEAKAPVFRLPLTKWRWDFTVSPMGQPTKFKKYKRSKVKTTERRVNTSFTKKAPRKLRFYKDTGTIEMDLGLPPVRPIADMVLQHVMIWTDGGCWKNPGGAGAWAAVMKFGEHYREISGYVEAPTTNNICELLAVLHAINAIKHPVRLTIHTDSRYVIAVATNARAIANRELVAQLRQALSVHKVQFVWVPGHSGVAENERCDRLCNSYRTSDTERYSRMTPHDIQLAIELGIPISA